MTKHPGRKREPKLLAKSIAVLPTDVVPKKPGASSDGVGECGALASGRPLPNAHTPRESFDVIKPAPHPR